MIRAVAFALFLTMMSTDLVFACSPVILKPPLALEPYEGVNAKPLPDSLKTLASEFGIDQNYVTELNSIYCDFMTTHDEDSDEQRINKRVISLIIQKWADYQ